MQNDIQNSAQPELRHDLHSHTVFSDGSLTPEELLLRAANRQIDVLAITDHDSVDALPVAKQVIIDKSLKLNLINGVEISTSWHGFEIHIVGLCVDPENQELKAALAEQIESREARAKAIAEKLHKLGIEGVYEDAQKLAGRKALSRTHFAKVLITRGVVSHFEGAFKKYLRKGKKAFVSPNWMDIETAVQVIHQAGGIAVMAHPVRYDMSNKWLTKLVTEFADWQGDALEVGLTQVSKNQRDHISRLARERNMYSSQGSDFHSPAKWTDLGKSLYLTDKCNPVWTHPKWRYA